MWRHAVGRLGVKRPLRGVGALWQMLDPRDRRRLRWAITGSGLLALLDMIGVALILPLTLALFDSDSTRSGFINGVRDRLGLGSTSNAAALLAAAVLAVFISRGLLAVVLLRHTLRIVLQAEATMAQRLLVGYLHAPLGYHVHHNSSEMQRTLGDSLRRIYPEGIATMVPAFGDALVIVLVAAVVAVFAPVEALVGGTAMGVIVVAYRRISSARARATSEEMLLKQQASVQHIQQSLGAVREIQLSDSADVFAADLLQVRQEMAAHQRRVLLTELLPRYLLEFGILISAGAVGAVAFLRYQPDHAVAVLALFVAAVVRILPSLNRALVASTRLSVALPNVATVDATLAELDAMSPAPADAMPLDPCTPFDRLLIEDISFRYEDALTPTLDGLRLEIDRGDYLGIIGGSGAGKTTLLNLILGLIDPTCGIITVDGTPLTDCRRSWQRRVGYVPQDVAFLDGPIIENVALGETQADIDHDRVRAALSDAQMLDTVESLPEGLETPVREAGARLSGGQRQRLGLARALYRSPELLVLDEATSSLDLDTESRLLETLEDLRRRMTIVVVAHRPSTIAACRRVVRLQDGRAVETSRLERGHATELPDNDVVGALPQDS